MRESDTTIPSPHSLALTTRCSADVYSFAMVMWSLWTGTEPWAGGDTAALLAAVLAGAEPRPPVPGAPEWPPSEPCPHEPARGWSELMRRCWAADPAARPTFSEVLAGLRAMFLKAKSQRRAARAAAAGSAGAAAAAAAAAAEAGAGGSRASSKRDAAGGG
ncbi:putative serine/threonine-protein kinase [Tetrabaena socialis]|uniref:Putative serine/threonine-protein kinase n=1 Tax=Tetrabaena socialis TaxID=47790 RepID=A0A2J7ZU71_9CHLO|nr:putative serine/threonine-protein kinase [Tetrabaena socialis]|eukprot:PNH03798.1 putative serine/threonine-protein kinase [Tetrabaena socialis]